MLVDGIESLCNQRWRNIAIGFEKRQICNCRSFSATLRTVIFGDYQPTHCLSAESVPSSIQQSHNLQ